MRYLFPLLLVLTALSARASNVDVDINIDGGRTPPRVVTTPGVAVTQRVWIPDQVIRKSERVCVAPAHVERRSEQVLVSPAHIEYRTLRVQVSPGGVERVRENVLVTPAHVERQWVPAEVRAETKIGPVRIKGVVEEGHWREVEVPAEYRVVEREIVRPAQYDVERRQVEIPAQYETVTKEYTVPARFEDVTRDVVIPGHFEERTVVTPATTVIEPGHRSGIDIDIDLFKKKKHDRD